MRRRKRCHPEGANDEGPRPWRRCRPRSFASLRTPNALLDVAIELRELLLQRFDLRTIVVRDVRFVRMQLGVVLMVRFGREEILERYDLRDDLTPAPCAILRQLIDERCDLGLLGIARVLDHRAILGSNVRTL